MTNFLPKNYKEPVTSKYMKFEQGDNNFQVLSSAIVGSEIWTTDDDGKRKPIRKRVGDEPTMNELEFKDGKAILPKHFWAFVVFNQDAEEVQILEITQKTIQRSIKSIVSNPKWGDPVEKGYSFTVSKDGQGMETSYMVTPNPDKLDPGVKQLYEDMNINLEALFDGDDPFTTEEQIFTKE